MPKECFVKNYLVVRSKGAGSVLRNQVVWSQVNVLTLFAAWGRLVDKRTIVVSVPVHKEVDPDVTLVVALPGHSGIVIGFAPTLRNKNVNIFEESALPGKNIFKFNNK
jgi:hypothetical protein